MHKDNVNSVNTCTRPSLCPRTIQIK